MSSKFEKLNLEQINSIPVYIEKWKKISFSTERIDREQAEEVANSIYEMLGYKSPNVLFFDSPYAVCNFILGQIDKQLKSLFGKPREVDYALHEWANMFREKIYSQIDIANIYTQIEHSGLAPQFNSLRSGIGTWEGIDYQIGNHIWQQLNKRYEEKIQKYLGQKLYRFVRPGIIIANSVCKLDYLISAFDLVFDKEKWETYKLLLQLSNHIFLQEKVCIICDRPIKISLDNKGYLHAEGEPAIQFADGYCLYSYHVVTLPKKYGEIHSSRWQPQWLLQENNWEVREALIKGIGYVKICHELSVKEIDCWNNFILLAIDTFSSSKIVYLLEINVNTAGIDRVKEVAKDVQSIQEAASFVDNYDDWDIASAESKGLEIPF